MNAQDSYSRLFTIFDSKNWLKNTFSDDALESLVNIIDNLKSEEQALILDLLQRYNWIKFNELESGLIKTVKNIESILSKQKKIYVGPVTKKSDSGEMKSGFGFTYMIKSHSSRSSKINSQNTRFISQYESLIIKSNEAIVITDDYIGSGKTVTDSIDELTRDLNISNDQIYIAVFAAQKSALQTLKEKKIKTYCVLQLGKGISDFYKKEAISEKLQLMKKIEKLLPRLKTDYSLGFRQTEALITFTERTPNNTFPIFWLKHEVNGKEYTAPFPR